MGKSQKLSEGFTGLEVLSLVLIAAALVLLSYIVFGSGTPISTAATATNTAKTNSTTTPTNPYAILPPATVASKTPECNQQLTFDSNGDSGPVRCANGDLNVLEWNTLAPLEPTALTLGYNATSAQVQAALCADANDSSSDANTKNSDVVEGTVYQIASLYYGWSFSSDPSAALRNNTC